jgi:hypothetical protein
VLQLLVRDQGLEARAGREEQIAAFVELQVGRFAADRQVLPPPT